MSGFANFLFNNNRSTAAAGDPYASSVVLLLHGNGANNGTVFTDNSGYNRVVTRRGTVVTSTTQAKWGTASMFWPTNSQTSGDSVDAPYSTDFNINTTAWTWECWAYSTAATTGYTNDQTLFSRRTGTSATGIVFMNDRVRAKINGTWNDLQITYSPPSINTWHHYALVKNGSVLTVYIDGVSAGSKTGITSMDEQSTTFRIGNATGGTSNELEWIGYIDDVRVTQGVARYTADFSVPSAEFPDIPTRPRAARTITAAGSAKQSTTSPTFGTASMLNAIGGTSWITASNDANLSNWYNNGSAYTVECWINLTNASNLTDPSGWPTLIGNKDGGGGTNYWSFGPLNTGVLRFYYYKGTSTVLDTTGITLTTGQNYHLAMVRSGTTISLYVDGTRYATASISGTPQSNAATQFNIGGSYGVSCGAYIDEIRVSRAARYSGASFSVPTQAFAFDSDTELLLHCDGANNSTVFVDSTS